MLDTEGQNFLQIALTVASAQAMLLGLQFKMLHANQLGKDTRFTSGSSLETWNSLLQETRTQNLVPAVSSSAVRLTAASACKRLEKVLMWVLLCQTTWQRSIFTQYPSEPFTAEAEPSLKPGRTVKQSWQIPSFHSLAVYIYLYIQIFIHSK